LCEIVLYCCVLFCCYYDRDGPTVYNLILIVYVILLSGYIFVKRRFAGGGWGEAGGGWVGVWV